MKWFAHRDVKPGRDGLNVYDFRAYITPASALEDLSGELNMPAKKR